MADGFEEFLQQKKVRVDSHYLKFVRDLSRIDSYKLKGKQIFLADSIIEKVNFSQIEARYVSKLIELSRARLPYSSLSDSVNILAKRAYSELGPDESQRVLLSCSILQSSYEYWLTEGKNWLDFANSIKKPGLAKVVWEPDWGSVAGADLAGAAAAAFPCIGATIGYGWCVSGAALGASAADLTIQLLQYLFPN